MARIDDLLAQVSDEQLREDLERELRQLRKRTPFGIVFERHIPEEVALLDVPVAPGDRVVGRAWSARKQPRVVESIREDGVAVLRTTGASARAELEDAANLMVLKQVGEAVFPGLRQVGSVASEDSARPWHVVVNGENAHVLQLLRAGMANRFTCVYIDPPYNSGKKDWRYNNRYVDKNDGYRHSKWLAMMDRRLRLTRELLAEDGVLVVAIDENEHAHLVMLLEQLFRGYEVVSVAIEHNPRGIQGRNFSYTNDFAVFVFRDTGEPRIARVPRPEERCEWQPLRNWGTESLRTDARSCFYPIYAKDGEVVGFGDVLPDDAHPAGVNTEGPDGTTAVWPVDPKGVERKWRYARHTIEAQREYLRVMLKGRGGAERLDVDLLKHDDAIRTLWVGRGDGEGNRYDANRWGTQLVNQLVPDEAFPFPKSLYSTRDALYAAVGDRPDALVLDFFGGSGTTLHATALLNAEDGGRRRCFLVTNNEVGAEAETRLRRAKASPGDQRWEREGIFHAVTMPRVTAALTGRAGEEPLAGTYIDGRALSEGLPDNAAFLELEYLDRDDVELGDALDRLQPLLWMAAEGSGPLRATGVQAATIDREAGWAVVRRPSGTREVASAIADGARISEVWVVTDSDDVFAGVASALPGIRVTQLYDRLLEALEESAEAIR
jgi:adenine-specific DNA-methyltransferase